MRENIIKKIRIASCILALIIIVSIFYFFTKAKQRSTPVINAAETAPRVLSSIKNCYDQGRSNDCYRQIAGEFVATMRLEDVFVALEQNETDSIVFQACHEVLHFVGQETYKNSKNVAESLSQGNPVCFAGFYHGVLESHLNEKNLMVQGEESLRELAKEIPILCADSSNAFDVKEFNECLHGLGHALMYATNSDLPSSLKLCDNLPTRDQQQWCYSGSFMENSTSSTNEDHPTQYLNKDNPLYPCDTLEHKYLDMCYTLQSFYFAKISGYDWQKTAALCRRVPLEFQEGCFNAIGQSQVGSTQDFNKMLEVCQSFPEQKFNLACSLGAVGALDDRFNDGPKRMAEFCSLTASQVKGPCYERMTYNIKNGKPSEPAENICAFITEAPYKQQCLDILRIKNSKA